MNEQNEQTNEHEFDNIASSVVERTIDEERDMRDMSLMFGFDGDGFEGDLSKALPIYEWALRNSASSEDAMLLINYAIKQTGANSTKKNLLGKVFQWISLEDSVQNLRKRQEALKI